jgi:hypothetical protein
MYKDLYPWPLDKLIYYSDYYFNRNKLKSIKLWNLDKKIVTNISSTNLLLINIHYFCSSRS